MFSRRSLTALLVSGLCTTAIHASADYHRPKLVVIIVIDQFRGDYLDRYRDQFGPTGFRLLMDHGAYFTECYYDYANTKTAAGHATIGTGTYTVGHDILGNEWWDLSRNTTRPVSSVEDERYVQVGGKNAGEGASPRNLMADTLGDELRLATGGKSRVYGISLKDRAAILTTGFSANGAFWAEPSTGRFVTSSYYMKQLPKWAEDFNNGQDIPEARKKAGVNSTVPFVQSVGPTIAGNAYQLNFAKRMITAEHLGKGDTADLLVVSLSSNDELGHLVGPDSPKLREEIVALDGQLSDFFQFVKDSVGGDIKDTLLALTADHGVGPNVATSDELKMPGTLVGDFYKAIEQIDKVLNRQLSPSKPLHFFLRSPSPPWVVLDPRSFAQVHLSEGEAEAQVAAMLPGALEEVQKEPVATAPAAARLRWFRILTKTQIRDGRIPSDAFGHMIANSFSERQEWWVMAIPGPFATQAQDQFGANHGSPFAYDRHVPLLFYGEAFRPGRYEVEAAPVDLAVTLAAVLHLNRPSAATGRVQVPALMEAAEGLVTP